MSQLKPVPVRDSQQRGRIIAVVAALGAVGLLSLRTPAAASAARTEAVASYSVAGSVDRVVAVLAALAGVLLGITALLKCRGAAALASPFPALPIAPGYGVVLQRLAHRISWGHGGRHGP
jgi:hypothetical protein